MRYIIELEMDGQPEGTAEDIIASATACLRDWSDFKWKVTELDDAGEEIGHSFVGSIDD